MLYAARVPERWKPGAFDVAFHSHQLFHVCVVVVRGVEEGWRVGPRRCSSGLRQQEPSSAGVMRTSPPSPPPLPSPPGGLRALQGGAQAAGLEGRAGRLLHLLACCGPSLLTADSCLQNVVLESLQLLLKPSMTTLSALQHNSFAASLRFQL